MPEILTIGEALIDFLSVDRGVLIEETTGFTVAPGGAPANVAAAVVRLGGSAGFVGKVGKDSFGRKIRAILQETGVDLHLFKMDRNVNTTLAFISVKENNEPDFTFYRNHCGADIALRPEELETGYITEASILHFGSLSFTHEPLRSAVIKAVEAARGAGRIISFDPNLRPSLWSSMDRAREEIENGMEYADIVKLTDEELEFVTGTADPERGTNALLKYGPRMIIVTRGSRSTFFNNGDLTFQVPVFKVDQVDTTGAGDAFVASMLVWCAGQARNGQPVFGAEEGELKRMVKRANASGAITVTRKGVIPALPTMQEVEQFLGSRG
jgi:sugar/nucleoside kinase (ribokinase family)